MGRTLSALGRLMVTVVSSRAPAAVFLSGLFDLTPSEARMAALLTKLVLR